MSRWQRLRDTPITVKAGAVIAMFLTVVALQVAIGFVGLKTNTLSCQRSGTVRHSQQGYEQYAVDAAQARATAASLNAQTAALNASIAKYVPPSVWRVTIGLARIQKQLAANDAWAARHFARDVEHTRIRILDCGGIFPDNP